MIMIATRTQMTHDTTMKIRKAEPADHLTLVDIWLRSVRATHTFLTETDIETLLPIVRDTALEGLEIWVLCAGNETEAEAVGFMGLSDADVSALFIAPEWIRRGGGRMLLDHAYQLKGRLTVEVNEQNPEATQFYLAYGFVVISRSEQDGDGRPFPLLQMQMREDEGQRSR
jgi:putative acetyltransferase